MRLGAIGPQRSGLPVGLDGFLMLTELVIGHAQIEPVLEAVGHRLGETAAIACGRREIAVPEGQRRQRLQIDAIQELAMHREFQLLVLQGRPILREKPADPARLLLTVLR